jgi:DNA-binding NarL/FixJ family response regulator
MAKALETVVVADANDLFRIGLREVVRRCPSSPNVIEAGDRTTLLQQLTDHRVDHAVVDQSLPGLDGLRDIAAIHQAHSDLCLAVTGPAIERRMMLEYLAAGARGYVPKDLSVGEMTSAMMTLLSGDIYLPGAGNDHEQRIASPAAEHAPSLTVRQRAVLHQLACGRSNKEIARQLKMAEGTVKVHIAASFRLLGVHNRVSAVTAFMALAAPAEQHRMLVDA